MNRNEILEKFDRLDDSEKKIILWSAIDFMQEDNSRTKIECLALAMNVKLD